MIANIQLDQFCIGEALSNLAKYERGSGKWKMLKINVATYTAIPIPQRVCADRGVNAPACLVAEQ